MIEAKTIIFLLMQLFSFFLCYDQQNVQLSILGLGEVYLTEVKFTQGVRLFFGVYPKLYK